MQGDWQVANMAAHMQARMQHQQQQGNSQQMPNPQLGPFGGPGSFPFYGEIMCSKLSQLAPKPLVTWNAQILYLDYWLPDGRCLPRHPVVNSGPVCVGVSRVALMVQACRGQISQCPIPFGLRWRLACPEAIRVLGHHCIQEEATTVNLTLSQLHTMPTWAISRWLRLWLLLR